MKYSSKNPITFTEIENKSADLGIRLCYNAYAIFDKNNEFVGLCALSTLLCKDRDFRKAVVKTVEQIQLNPYCRGFADGWDGRKCNEKAFEYMTGYWHAQDIISVRYSRNKEVQQNTIPR